jgi:nicotinate-nucleotide adenylyltransferase
VNKRIGFFAGSFDPIHDGHIELAKVATDQLELSKIYFMVEEKPWGIKRPISINHRKEMVRLAIDGVNSFGQLDLLDKQFTIENTLKQLEKKFENSELYFVFGADVFMNMNSDQWPGLEKLLRHYIVVFERKDITELELAKQAKRLGIVVAILPNKHKDHSSTDVRMKPHKKSIWLPKKVAEYIDLNGLYKVSDSLSE